MPVEKRVKYVPSIEDIYKVIALADADTQDYLWLILHTLGRVSEINRLEWKDVDFYNQRVTLFTRKKRGGHLTPRLVPMTDRVFKILSGDTRIEIGPNLGCSGTRTGVAKPVSKYPVLTKSAKG